MKQRSGTWVVLACAIIPIIGCLTKRPPEPMLDIGIGVPTRDGMTLVADVMTPGGTERYPTILELTPYGRGPEGVNYRNEIDYWVERGYAFVIVDTRGEGDSDGAFEFFAREGQDASDVIAWIAVQPWSNGHVGMRGSSYTGTNQLYAAREQPLNLSCITPSAAAEGPMADLPYENGAFRFDWALSWPSVLQNSEIVMPADVEWWDLLEHRPLRTADEVVFGRPSSLYRLFLDHPRMDSYWRQIQLREADYARIEVPSLSFTGWFDGTLPGTIAHYQGMREHSQASQHFLIIGPWEHLTAPDGGVSYLTGEPATQVGDIELPVQAFLPGQQITRRFFDWCAKGEGKFSRSSATIYLTGSNRWLELSDYPPPSMSERSLFLHSGGAANGVHGDGVLRWEEPTDAVTDNFIYDPLNPFPSAIRDAEGAWRSLGSQPVDITALLDRPDVLTYVTDPLDEPLSIAGNVVLVLWASSDAPDTDLVSLIEDISPDGSAIKLGPKFGGQARARFRNGFDREEPLVPGEPTEFRIDYSHIGHTFLSGHRIRVSITSSAYPWVFPNPNTGKPLATDTEPPRSAQQRIYHDANYPSRVLLPILDELPASHN